LTGPPATGSPVRFDIQRSSAAPADHRDADQSKILALALLGLERQPGAFFSECRTTGSPAA